MNLLWRQDGTDGKEEAKGLDFQLYIFPLSRISKIPWHWELNIQNGKREIIFASGDCETKEAAKQFVEKLFDVIAIALAAGAL